MLYFNIVSGNNVTLKDRAEVEGYIYANGICDLGSDVVVTGEITEGASVVMPSLPDLPVLTPGTQDITVNSGETLQLSPGIYRDLTLNPNSLLRLSPGNYVFRRLDVRDDAGIILEVDILEDIDIDVS